MKQYFRAAGSLALLGVAFWLLDVKAMARAMGSLSAVGVSAALAVTLLVYVPLAWRWVLLARPLVPRSFVEHLKYYLVATFINAFTPANLGGDAYRVAALRTSGGGAGPVISAVVRERVLGLLAYLMAGLLLIAVMVLPPGSVGQGFLPTLQWIAAVVLLAVVVLLAAPLLTGLASRTAAVRRSPMLWRAVRVMHEGMHFASWQEFVWLLGLSLAGLGIWVVAVKIVAADLGLAITWPALGLVVVLAELLRMVPTTIQGIGIREAAFAYLVGQLGGAPESGFVLGGIAYIVLTAALAVCGALGWFLAHFVPTDR